MTTYTIERDIEIDAPVEVVWRTITEPDQVRRWLCDSVEVEPQSGTNGTLTFDRDDDEPLVVNLTVVAVEPHRLYSFRWCYPSEVSATPANSVLVTFTLASDGAERTRLRVEETGLEDVDWPDDEKDTYVESHQDGWQTRGEILRLLFAAEQT